MRAHEKKKAYKRALRQKAVEGRINDPNGHFIDAKSDGTGRGMDEQQLAGYKVGTYARK